MDDSEFEKLVADGLDAISDEHAKFIDNVAIVFADQPTPEQIRKLHLRPNTFLFGLYEGVPRTRRSDYQIALPDKITIFKNPIVEFCGYNKELIRQQVARTVEHEIAHHFGLDEHEVRAKGL